MQKLKTAAMAAIMAASAMLTALMPFQAQADTSWQTSLLVSSAQARFEATPTGYDSVSNKYKYQFSWLMPKYKVYSFKIDGKMYMPAVSKNGSAETPYWFSPDITYSVQIFSRSHGGGTLVGEGTFTAPSVKSTLTQEQEITIIDKYIQDAPDLPHKTIKSALDVAQIKALDEGGASGKLSDHLDILSAKSVEMLNKTPLFLAELDKGSTDETTQIGPDKIKIYAGGEYATVTYKVRVKVTRKTETRTLVLIKENGAWKFDLIQTLKFIL